MNRTSLTQILALGAATGMRSFSGPACLALQHGGPLKALVPVMAAGEMIADKTPYIGDRIDAGPLAGRAVMGAVVGAVIARQAGESVGLGMLAGSLAAVLTAHAAYQVRKRLPLPMLAGLAEDALVVGICSRYAPSR